VSRSEVKEVLRESGKGKGVGPAGRAYVMASGSVVPAEHLPLSQSESVRQAALPHSEDSSSSHAQFILHRLLAVAELAAIVMAAVAAVLLAEANERTLDIGRLALTMVAMAPVWFLIAYGAGLYHEIERRIDHNFVDELGTIAIASTAWCWFFVLARSLFVTGGTDLLVPGLLWTLMIPLLLMSRAMVRRHARRQSWNQRPVVTIGDSAGVAALTQRIDRHSEWGLNVQMEVGLRTDNRILIRDRTRHEDESEDLPEDEDRSYLIQGHGGMLERDLASLVKESGVDRAIIAGGFQDLSSRTRLIHELIERGITVDQISGGPETLYSNAVFHDLEGLPVLSVRPTSPRPIARRIKRAIDVAGSALGLILVSPILLWAAIRIKLDSKGPVFYRQIRCGLDGREFELFKLRTMVDGAHDMRAELRLATEASGNDDVLFKLKDDPRVTKFGGLLRRTSLDELPQLWNVLIGDMSMVGPRPLVFEEARQATDLFSARTRMKPGIAGPWQALGRSSIPFEDMIKLDYAYVVGWSMSEDLRLFLRTCTAVTRRNGAH